MMHVDIGLYWQKVSTRSPSPLSDCYDDVALELLFSKSPDAAMA